MWDAEVEAEHAMRWASAVRRHISTHAPFGGEVHLLDEGRTCRVVLWRNAARTRSLERDLSSRDIVDWGEHVVGELFGLLHKSIFGQSWHIAMPKDEVKLPKIRREAPSLAAESQPEAVIISPISIDDAKPTGPLPALPEMDAIIGAFHEYTQLESWPIEATLELIDEGTTVAFVVEGDRVGRFRQTIPLATFWEQQMVTITRFLTKYHQRKESDTSPGIG